MGIFNKIGELICEIKRNFKKKVVDLNKLPSKNLFYPQGFKITLKPVEKTYIENFKTSFISSNKNPILISRLMKKIVKNSIIEKDNFEEILSIDIMYLFIIIVNISYSDKFKIEEKLKHFNFDKYRDYYNDQEKVFEIKGFKYAPPKCLIQEDVINFVLNTGLKRQKEIPERALNFIFFIKDKKRLKTEEIDNLLTIFSEELSDNDKKLINLIVQKFSGMNIYKLKNNKVLNIDNLIKTIF